MMKNLTARTVTIHQGVKVATMSAANIVPHMLAPEERKVQTPPNQTETDVKTSMKSVSVMEKNERSSSVEGDARHSTVDMPH